AAAPRVGPYLGNTGLPCEYWPTPPKPVPTSYRAAGSPTILVFGTTGDNATPYANSQHIAGMLENARLATLKADRHTAVGANACATKTKTHYLPAPTAPPAAPTC